MDSSASVNREVLVVVDDPRWLKALAIATKRAFGPVNVHSENTLRSAKAAADLLHHLQLILIDVDLPDCRDLEGVTHFSKKFDDVPVTLLSAKNDFQSILSSLKAGAAGYILKSSPKKIMIAALQLVRASGRYVPPQILDAFLDDDGRAVKLTPRQREVLRLLLDGHSTPRIAGDLKIAQGTAKQHIRAIYDTLEVSTRAQLFAAAAQGRVRHDHTPITKVL